MEASTISRRAIARIARLDLQTLAQLISPRERKWPQPPLRCLECGREAETSQGLTAYQGRVLCERDLAIAFRRTR